MSQISSLIVCDVQIDSLPFRVLDVGMLHIVRGFFGGNFSEVGVLAAPAPLPHTRTPGRPPSPTVLAPEAPPPLLPPSSPPVPPLARLPSSSAAAVYGSGLCIYIYIYMYIYKHRERERD